jgi:hypothetical protein
MLLVGGHQRTALELYLHFGSHQHTAPELYHHCGAPHII